MKKPERSLKMLSLVPWVNAQGTTTFKELCRRFDYKPRELLKDLMVLYCVGIPPYSPGELVELEFTPAEDVHRIFEEGKTPKPDWTVSVRLAQSLSQPPSLSPVEILNLFLLDSASRELGLENTQGEILGSAVEKIKKALGVETDSGIELNLEPQKTEIHEMLEKAAIQKRQTDIDYHSLRENSRLIRRVEPWQIFFADNAWYLLGYDHLDKAERLFRTARIITVNLLEDSFTQSVPANLATREPSTYIGDSNSSKIVLELDSSARWALDLFVLNEKPEYLSGGKIRVSLLVGSDKFLESLMLQLGGSADVISGDYPKDFGKKAARKLLQKYYEN